MGPEERLLARHALLEIHHMWLFSTSLGGRRWQRQQSIISANSSIDRDLLDFTDEVLAIYPSRLSRVEGSSLWYVDCVLYPFARFPPVLQLTSLNHPGVPYWSSILISFYVNSW